MSSAETIILRPRPFALYSGSLLLLPLLPHRKPLKPLPAEIWAEILTFALAYNRASREPAPVWAWSLVAVCKAFHDNVLPLLYSNISICQISTLEKFYDRLQTADQKWDSIRRIPYSTPGRWVQILDLTDLVFMGQAQALLLDSLLTQLFPLTPLLSILSVNPSFVLSRRALSALALRDGAINIRVLSGLRYVMPSTSMPDEDPYVQLLRCCPNLEELSVVGQALDPMELEFESSSIERPSMISFTPLLALPKLRELMMLSMYTSPLMHALLQSPLPGLTKLTITPYDDIPYPASLASQFISVHGENLKSLLLLTPKSWPTRLHPSPTNILTCAPNVLHLSLEAPLPTLTLTGKHHLKILSIPRPNAEFWRVLERLLPSLPDLTAIRTRDVRWLRKGVTSMAQEAGVQGEMKEWRRRLERRGIRLLDTTWHDSGSE
ncbi:hypothetical protein BYT27DRAFT_7223754 [Phlegmacium glaucopus]|nr:hypothetical protein BYT27DRAFT_7223754 [Phlegmacium glaucopus]